jgi:hypothetical protein
VRIGCESGGLRAVKREWCVESGGGASIETRMVGEGVAGGGRAVKVLRVNSNGDENSRVEISGG